MKFDWRISIILDIPELVLLVERLQVQPLSLGPSTLGLLSEEDVKHRTNTAPTVALGVWRNFGNNARAESLVILSVNMVPGALLTLGSVPGFPSTAQNKTTESDLFIVSVNHYSWSGQLRGVPVTRRDNGARRAVHEMLQGRAKYLISARSVSILCIHITGLFPLFYTFKYVF